MWEILNEKIHVENYRRKCVCVFYMFFSSLKIYPGTCVYCFVTLFFCQTNVKRKVKKKNTHATEYPLSLILTAF